MLFGSVNILIASSGANELDTETTDDFGPTEFGLAASQCQIASVCLDIAAPFGDSDSNGAADPLTVGGNRDWGDSGWSVNLCCSSHQKLEILASAENGGNGASDCRQTPITNAPKKVLGSCSAGCDVGVGKAFNVNGPGQSYAAVAWVKLVDVHEPEIAMFRARLTIHGYDAVGRLQQECNAFLRSTEIDGVPGTVDQTEEFVPIEIPECEMLDTGTANGLNQVITKVDVTVRANAFKNDIAYGIVRVQRLMFTRLS